MEAFSLTLIRSKFYYQQSVIFAYHTLPIVTQLPFSFFFKFLYLRGLKACYGEVPCSEHFTCNFGLRGVPAPELIFVVAGRGTARTQMLFCYHTSQFTEDTEKGSLPG